MSDLSTPYFVYGTLRPGFGNADVWQAWRAVVVQDGYATVTSHSLAMAGLPYAIPAPGLVVGALIIPSTDESERFGLRRALDRLEDHPDHYERVLTSVAFNGYRVDAWIYQRAPIPQGAWVVPSGDYRVARQQERHPSFTRR